MSAHLTQLFSLLLGKGATDKLLKVVTESRHEFVERGEVPLWQFWNAQALIASGQIDSALETIRQISDSEQKRALEALAFRALADRSGDKSKLLAHLQESFTNTGNALYLFELCEIKANEK